MNNQDEKHRPETEEEEDNLEQESNQNQKNDWPETLQNLRDNVNEEYKPFDNGYNSPLTLPIIKEKIESVLHFASLPLVEDGTLESLLYQTWHTDYDASMNPSLPADFFSVEHIQRRERELYNPGTHLLQNLIDLVESAVPSIEPRRMPPSEGQNTMPETDLLASVDCQTGLQRAVTPPNDNFGNNFRSPPFSPPRLPKYLPVASGYSVSNQMAQFDSLTPNLSSSLFGTPPVTPTSHLPPGNLQSDSQSVKPSSSSEPCRYCIATYKFPQDHNKKECPKLACMKPCKVCHASGHQNHTLIESPILRLIRSVPLAWWFYNIMLEYCPFKKKVVLKLKCDKRNDDDKDNEDNENDKNDKDS